MQKSTANEKSRDGPQHQHGDQPPNNGRYKFPMLFDFLSAIVLLVTQLNGLWDKWYVEFGFVPAFAIGSGFAVFEVFQRSGKVYWPVSLAFGLCVSGILGMAIMRLYIGNDMLKLHPKIVIYSAASILALFLIAGLFYTAYRLVLFTSKDADSAMTQTTSPPASQPSGSPEENAPVSRISNTQPSAGLNQLNSSGITANAQPTPHFSVRAKWNLPPVFSYFRQGNELFWAVNAVTQKIARVVSTFSYIYLSNTGNMPLKIDVYSVEGEDSFNNGEWRPMESILGQYGDFMTPMTLPWWNFYQTLPVYKNSNPKPEFFPGLAMKLIPVPQTLNAALAAQNYIIPAGGQIEGWMFLVAPPQGLFSKYRMRIRDTSGNEFMEEITGPGIQSGPATWSDPRFLAMEIGGTMDAREFVVAGAPPEVMPNWMKKYMGATAPTQINPPAPLFSWVVYKEDASFVLEVRTNGMDFGSTCIAVDLAEKINGSWIETWIGKRDTPDTKIKLNNPSNSEMAFFDGTRLWATQSTDAFDSSRSAFIF